VETRQELAALAAAAMEENILPLLLALLVLQTQAAVAVVVEQEHIPAVPVSSFSNICLQPLLFLFSNPRKTG
jgi:hypothetical protein